MKPEEIKSAPLCDLLFELIVTDDDRHELTQLSNDLRSEIHRRMKKPETSATTAVATANCQATCAAVVPKPSHESPTVVFDTPMLRRMMNAAIRNLHVNHSEDYGGRELWVAVRDLFGIGSKTAQELCKHFGFRPAHPLN